MDIISPFNLIFVRPRVTCVLNFFLQINLNSKISYLHGNKCYPNVLKIGYVFSSVSLGHSNNLNLHLHVCCDKLLHLVYICGFALGN